MALVNTIGSQVAAGSSFQNAVVRLANYRANTVRDTTGLCECSGGNGHCCGCDAIPVFQTRIRVPGADGAEGRRGDIPVVPLLLVWTEDQVRQRFLSLRKLAQQKATELGTSSSLLISMWKMRMRTEYSNRESISSFVGFASRTLVSFPIMHLYY